jgi:hypothetical protein
MSIFRRSGGTKSSATRRTPVAAVGDPRLVPPIAEPAPPVVEIKPSSGSRDDSDVFVCEERTQREVEEVTLFVFGWHNVEPGPLSWAFPSLRAALGAVRTMRNAAKWCIVSGDCQSLDAARARGAVLIEQLG